MIDTNFKKFSVLILLCMILAYLNTENNDKILGGEENIHSTQISQKMFEQMLLCRKHFADYEKKAKDYIKCKEKPNNDCSVLKKEMNTFKKKNNVCLYKDSINYKKKLHTLWKQEKDLLLNISQFIPLNENIISTNSLTKIINENGEEKTIIPITKKNIFSIYEKKDIYKTQGILTLECNKTVKWSINPFIEPIKQNIQINEPELLSSPGQELLSPIITEKISPNLKDYIYFTIDYNPITKKNDLLKSTIIFDYKTKDEYKFNISAQDLQDNIQTKLIIIKIIK